MRAVEPVLPVVVATAKMKYECQEAFYISVYIILYIGVLHIGGARAAGDGGRAGARVRGARTCYAATATMAAALGGLLTLRDHRFRAFSRRRRRRRRRRRQNAVKGGKGMGDLMNSPKFQQASAARTTTSAHTPERARARARAQAQTHVHENH